MGRTSLTGSGNFVWRPSVSWTFPPMVGGQTRGAHPPHETRYVCLLDSSSKRSLYFITYCQISPFKVVLHSHSGELRHGTCHFCTRYTKCHCCVSKYLVQWDTTHATQPQPARSLHSFRKFWYSLMVSYCLSHVRLFCLAFFSSTLTQNISHVCNQ